ncbi:MAG: hypothetical protein HY431_01265 [Candidatus Levybacteria bacterium]|nr:hypothetical protein [Candidatus Levybacteria bacterium]
MKIKKIHLAIIILLFLAGFLSFGIVRNYQTIKAKSTTIAAETTDKNVPTPPQSLLPPPPARNASEADKKKYRELIMSMAQETNILVFGEGCTSSLPVISIESGKLLILKNSDNKEHTFVVNVAHTYTIPANGEKTITADFGKGKGIYDYACDDSLRVRGLLLVR